MDYRKIVKILFDAAKTKNGITYIGFNGEEDYVSYKELLKKSYYVTKKLNDLGATRGVEVIIKCGDVKNFITSYWACVLGEFVAVPVESNNNEYVFNENDKILNVLDNPYLLYDDEKVVDVTSEKLATKSLDISNVEFADATDVPENLWEGYLNEEHLMYIQFSSGSMGEPKGALLNCTNIITNTEDIIEKLGLTCDDSFLSWQPLTHCYGLMVFHIAPLAFGINQYQLRTPAYIKNPILWMEKVNQHRVSRLGSIPFAVKLFMDVYDNIASIPNWDLSCIKSITLGGEQVSNELCCRFSKAMKKHHMAQDIIMPGYGMAEATAVVSAVNVHTQYKCYNIGQGVLDVGTKLELEELTNEESGYVEIGTPLKHVEVRITDDEGNVLDDSTIGHICLSGPSITTGYYGNVDTADTIFFGDKWLDTGDLGFMKDGSIIVIGRQKELIVVGGVKYSCADIDGTINSKIERIYKNAIVCNGFNRKNKQEEAIVFVQTDFDVTSGEAIMKLRKYEQEVKNVVFLSTGLMIAKVIPVEEFPQTFSGKIKRRELSTNYNDGKYDDLIEKIESYDETATDVKKTAKQKTKFTFSELSKEEIRGNIVDIVEELLDFKIEDYDMLFQEYGIVSLNIPSFVEKINFEFSVESDVASVFNFPTINKYTEYIWELLNSKVDKVDSEKEGEVTKKESDKIAVVGMSCRFPGGANNIDEFWKLLMNGDDGVSVIPSDRWNKDKYYDTDENVPGKMYCDKGGFLSVPVHAFDPSFFNISPKEAMSLAPEQRMLLELVWEAFENGNINIAEYNGSNTGVYIGIASNEYALSHLYSGDLSKIDAYSLTGSCFSTACGRVAYTFGFEGPCLAVDTACSSSLTALHLAVTAMKNGEADMAVVGGVNIMLSPTANIGFSKLHATSPDGHCKSFDEDANGYCRSEGCGVIVLKRLEDAKRDHDHILGVIAATAINQDGKSNGLTAPSGTAQGKLIEKALQSAGIDPLDVDYIETHGTGTKLGDPIEAGAIMSKYCVGRSKNHPLYIGSVKSNIGHMEAASGMASVIKVLLSMRNSCIPGNINFNKPNPLIDWDSAAIQVVSNNTLWEKEGIRRAGINGFGFGGSNAHIIIEEYKENETSTESEGIEYILKLSAKSEKSLSRYVDSYINYLADKDDDDLSKIIYNANRGRVDFDYRLCVTGSTVNEIREKLKAYARNEKSEGLFSNVNSSTSYKKNRKVLFMYTGQGSTYVNMGRRLYETNKVFRDAVDKCERLFKPYIIKSLVNLMYSEDANTDMVTQTVYAQPLIFTIEYAMTEYLASIGIHPSAVIGHSIGEYAAAVAAKIMSLETAVKLVSIRGRLMDSAPGHGTMGTIFAGEEFVSQIIAPYRDKVSIAVRNTEDTFVISGEADIVEKLLQQAGEKGYKTNQLHVSHAFHSEMMSPILEDFRSFVGNDNIMKESKIPFISCLYGRELHEDEVLDAEYWTRHISEKVDFYQAITSIDKSEEYVFLEVGAHTVLASLCKLIYGEERIIEGMLSRKVEDKYCIANAISHIYVAGVTIDWKQIEFEGKGYTKDITLPTYSYDRAEYKREMFIEKGNMSDNASDSMVPLLGMRIESPLLDDAVIFQNQFKKDKPYFMGEHIIFDTPISPAAAHVSMTVSAMRDLKNPASITLSEVEFSVPLAINGEETRKVQFCFENVSEENNKFQITSKSQDESEWELHAKGNVKAVSEYQKTDKTLDITKIEQYDYDTDINNSIYKMMNDSGFELGEGFRRIMKCHVEDGKGICFIKPLNTVPGINNYIMYPGIIDSVLQTLLCTVYEEISRRADKETNAKRTIIPYFLGKLVYNYREFNNLWCVATATIKDDVVYGNIEAYNEKGELIIEITDSMGKLTDRNSLLRQMKKDNTTYLYHTSWKETINNYSEFTTDNVVIIAENDAACNRMKEYIGELKQDIIVKNFEDTDLYDVINWGIEGTCRIVFYTEDVKKAETNNKALEHLFNLTKHIMMQELGAKYKIKIVTENVISYENKEEVNIKDAVLWGFARTMAVEASDIYDGVIDISGEVNKKQLMEEIISTVANEVCLHNGVRYESELVKHSEFIKDASSLRETIKLKADATYIVTGGTGVVGRTYTKYLAENGAKHIVVVSRKQADEAVMTMVEAYAKQGVEIKTMNADVISYEAVRRMVVDIKSTMPSIKGVIHAAGVLRDKMLRDMTFEDFEFVLAPKQNGTMNMIDTVEMEELDFFIMTSSVTSIVGNIGQSNYAAANYYMNAIADKYAQKGIPVYACCWGPWQGEGMVADNEATGRNMSFMGITPFEHEISEQIIGEFFSSPTDGVVFADVDWNKYFDNMPNKGKTSFVEKLIKKTHETGATNNMEATAFLEKLEGLNQSDRKKVLLEKLQKHCSEIMGFDKGQKINVNISVNEQGADSLMIFSMRTAINKMLNLELNVSVFFNYPTLTMLTDYLVDEVLFKEENIESVEISSDGNIDDLLSEIDELINE